MGCNFATKPHLKSNSFDVYHRKGLPHNNTRDLKGKIMSNENVEDGDEDLQDNEHVSEYGYATCLHCNNSFPVSKGVVTSEAAHCDVCNGG